MYGTNFKASLFLAQRKVKDSLPALRADISLLLTNLFSLEVELNALILLYSVYKDGFGDPSSSYWLGNDNIHFLTSGRSMDIMFIPTAWDWSQIKARYEGFFIEDEAANYKLHSGTFIFTTK